jgi:hypothetical protein
MALSAERLKQLLDYDARTGEFYWLNTKGRAKAGKRAGGTDAYGYRVIRVDGVLYKAHRLAWLWCYGRWPDGLLDHIDRTKNNNSIENLREVSQSENMHNANKRSKSGVPGVRWREERRRWVAQIRVGYRNHVIGSFATKNEAIAARRAAERNMVSSIYKTGASDE